MLPIVTPLAGVWIEISKLVLRRIQKVKSLPLWECGLKLSYPDTLPPLLRHSPCGSVDWNVCWVILPVFHTGHSPCGSVDWNHLISAPILRHRGHSPCGSVDWNMIIGFAYLGIVVTPLVGVWIEMSFSLPCCSNFFVTPLAGVWIKIWGDDKLFQNYGTSKETLFKGILLAPLL